jgi:hypothetical protein
MRAVGAADASRADMEAIRKWEQEESERTAARLWWFKTIAFCAGS